MESPNNIIGTSTKGNLSLTKLPNNKLLLGVMAVLAIGVITAIIVGANKPEAIPAPTPKKVGIVQVFGVLDTIIDGVKQGMTELGYTEGKNVFYEYRSWEQDPAKIDGMVQDLIDKNVDLIFTVSSPSAFSALKLTKESGKLIPIVHTYVDEPQNSGVALSLKSSGNHATGIASNMADVIPKQFEFLKRLNPNVKKLGVFTTGYMNPKGPGVLVLKSIKENAPKFGITLVEYTTTEPLGPNLKGVMQAQADNIGQGEIDAFLHLPGHFVDEQPFIESALGRRLKIINVMPAAEELEGTGGVFTYSADSVALGKQAAVMMDKIFRGAKPTDIPIEFPNKNVLVINKTNAETIGVTIPEDVFEVAERVLY